MRTRGKAYISDAICSVSFLPCYNRNALKFPVQKQCASLWEKDCIKVCFPARLQDDILSGNNIVPPLSAGNLRVFFRAEIKRCTEVEAKKRNML